MTEVLQVDRDAAADAVEGILSGLTQSHIRSGAYDGDSLVQNMVRHRTAGQAELFEAAREVLSHRVGNLPSQGWLKDNDGSRASLAKLAAALQPLSQAGGERS